jgi:hypothetical protein
LEVFAFIGVHSRLKILLFWQEIRLLLHKKKSCLSVFCDFLCLFVAIPSASSRSLSCVWCFSWFTLSRLFRVFSVFGGFPLRSRETRFFHRFSFSLFRGMGALLPFLRRGLLFCTSLPAMSMRTFGFGIMGALAITLAGGCTPSDPVANSSILQSTNPPTQHFQVLARIHWLGKKRIAAGTNSARFMAMWNLPESARLEAQTLDKLALALGGASNSSATDPQLITGFPAATRLRPLLDDILLEEFYLEVRQATNQPCEIALAIRLNEQRAALWQTSLGTLTNGLRPPSYQRVADWTIVSLTRLAATRERSGGESANSSLSTDFVSRIQRDHTPFAPSATDFWLEAQIDPWHLAKALSLRCDLPDSFPVISGTVIGDGKNIRMNGTLAFSQALPSELESWQLPTNLVHRRLVGFTAVRGVAPLLRNLKLFPGIASNSVPNQLYLWDLAGAPFDTFFALPSNEATNLFERVGPPIIAWVNPRLTPETGAILLSTNAPYREEWLGLTLGSPFLEAVTNSSPEALFGGFGVHVRVRTNQMLPELQAHLLEGTNLVYYDVEHTVERLNHWRYLDDCSRILFDARRSPRVSAQSATARWVVAIGTNLTDATTEVRQTGSRELTFAQRSSIGLTGFEIEVLLNWLEMPEFPGGLEKVFQPDNTPPTHRVGSRKAGSGVPAH